MSEETATTEEAATTTETTTETTEEQRVPYERFQQANKKAKESADRAKALEREMRELREQMQERENAGLPELERLKKDMEKAQRRAEEAEARAQEADAKVQRGQKERWVTAAAAAQNFADPSDASAFLSLDDIEDEKDAERAVKRLAGQKKHLVKTEDPKLPGRVLQNGQPAQNGQPVDPVEAQRQAEGQMIYEGIKNLTRNWQSGGSL